MRDLQETSRLEPQTTSRGDAGKAIAISNHCWLLHRWSPWTLYETVRPMRCVGPALRHAAEVIELRRRRRCLRCGKRDDRFVDQRPGLADAPERLRGYAKVDR